LIRISEILSDSRIRPMAKRHGKTPVRRRLLGNQRRERLSFAEALSLANRRAHEQANRRSGRRDLKSVRAVIAAEDYDEDPGSVAWLMRLARWVLALVREAVDATFPEELEARRAARRRSSPVLGAFDSGRSDISERHDEMLGERPW